jgi:hypothetical protein
MKSERELKELAEKHGVKTTMRRWFDCKTEDGRIETRFMDLPRPRADILDELEELGAMQ